ncbi:MAG: dihydroorotase [Firmicutes bacterium]|nr:dihydroorotase [Bacillota bacterium]
MKTLIKNGYIVSEYADMTTLMDILCEDGKIVKIEKDIEDPEAKIIDAQGRYVFPGFIDMHCSMSNPAGNYIESFESLTKAAAKGGFSTITLLPSTNPPVDNDAIVDYIVSKGKSYSNIGIYPYGSMTVGCEGKVLANIGHMVKAGIVALSDGDRAIDKAQLLMRIMQYSRMFDICLITHCEEQSLACGGDMNEGTISIELGLRGIPEEAETIHVSRNILLAEGTKAKLHICHVSTKKTVDLIRQAKKRGVQITAETCPQYFSLTEDTVLGYNTYAKLNPPLRTKEDVDAVIEGLCDGTIDVISSGHSPVSGEEKRVEFGNASFGVSSLETAVSVVITELLQNRKILNPMELAEKMSGMPAKILKIKSKGEIKVGYDADFTIVNLKEQVVVDTKNFRSKSRVTPYADMFLNGCVVYTISAGETAYKR